MTDRVGEQGHVEPRRWLVLVTEYAGLTPYTGGIGRHYASLLPALVRTGIQIDLVVFFDGDPLPDARLHGVRLIGYHRLTRVPRILLPLVRALVARRYLRAPGYDVVFTPEWAACASLAPRSAPVITNLATSTRLSNTISGFTSRSFGVLGGFAVALQSRLEDRQIRRSRGLIPISTAMIEWNRSALGDLPPSVVVRNCIDVGGVRSGAAAATLPAGWPTGSGAVVMFLGRLERRKGVVQAVEAFALLTRDHPELRLVLAGASGDSRFEPSRQQLLALVPEHARERIVFLGHVPGDELYRAVSEADVVTSPSLWEGFGNVALEAKALGAALVVTTGSGFDDFTVDGDDALMVPPGDGRALAGAIGRLLDDTDVADALGARARLSAERFTAGAVAPDLAAAVDSLLT